MAVSYSFASMRIRILEGDLLSPAFMDRLISSENPQEFLSILKESRYSRVLDKDTELGNFEENLADELRYQASKLNELIEEDWLKQFIFAQYDLHNLKVLIKEEYAKIEGEKPFNSPNFQFGSLNKEKIVELISHPNRGSDNPLLKEIILKGVETWKSTKDARNLDLVVDSAYFNFIKEAGKKGKSKFLVEYAEKLADSINVLSFFRAKRMDETRDFMINALVEGGSLNKELFASLYGSENIDFSKFFSKAKLGYAFDKAIADYMVNKDITALEKARDNMSIAFAQKAKQFREGPEVLFSYFIKVENEIKNLRIIMSAKRAGVEEESIKERIRAYV